MTQLHADRFLLRPFTAADAPAFASAVRETAAAIARWMGWAHEAYSEEEALAWFDACDAARRDGSAHEFGIFDARDGGFVGGAGLNQFNPRHGFCNLGYWVRSSRQRQGAALAAVRALAPHAFGPLGRTRVEIVVADGNAASMAVAEQTGALREGLARNRLLLNGKPLDAWVYSLVPDA